jgi:hypothetical protein
MRYSNIDALHETASASHPADERASEWNQCACGTSPLAIAMKLATRDSDASGS